MSSDMETAEETPASVKLSGLVADTSVPFSSRRTPDPYNMVPPFKILFLVLTHAADGWIGRSRPESRDLGKQ